MRSIGDFCNSASEMHDVAQPVSTSEVMCVSPTLIIISATMSGLGSCFSWAVSIVCAPAAPWAGALIRNPRFLPEMVN